MTDVILKSKKCNDNKLLLQSPMGQSSKGGYTTETKAFILFTRF